MDTQELYLLIFWVLAMYNVFCPLLMIDVYHVSHQSTFNDILQGPNPLSCKKKKRKDDSSVQQNEVSWLSICFAWMLNWFCFGVVYTNLFNFVKLFIAILFCFPLENSAVEFWKSSSGAYNLLCSVSLHTPRKSNNLKH